MTASILIWFGAQTETFQNWAINKVTTGLTEKLGTPVSVDYVDIDFFNKLVLEGFYVEDDHGDTLLYSGSLTSSLSANLLALIGRDLDIDEVTLENASFFMNRKEGERDSNLERLLEKLVFKEEEPDKPKSSGNPFLPGHR